MNNYKTNFKLKCLFSLPEDQFSKKILITKINYFLTLMEKKIFTKVPLELKLKQFLKMLKAGRKVLNQFVKIRDQLGINRVFEKFHFNYYYLLLNDDY